jgi:hypothetical protein
MSELSVVTERVEVTHPNYLGEGMPLVVDEYVPVPGEAFTCLEDAQIRAAQLGPEFRAERV